jgi:PST family polysaccharide transporter
MPAHRSDPANSYRQIVRSSSIIGGAQGVNYAIAMVRTKLVAVLLGPSGVGLVGLYLSATSLIGTIAGLGLESSAVREVADAHGNGDPQRFAHCVKTLRRVSWLSGLLGWLSAAALSYPLSVWAFKSPERALAIALLGGTVLLGTLTGSRTAIIQGTRRIGDLARVNVFGAGASTIVAIVLYGSLGERGVVPVLMVTAAINFGAAWWFSRKVRTMEVTQTWADTLMNSRRLVTLGMAFMYGALLAAVVELIIRSLTVRNLGLEANGIYQAAWSISGLFAGFILNAMSADFFPRLTAVAHDNERINQLVNEQTEIGILLALPGLLITLALAPWVIQILYSTEFTAGADLLPWLVLGVFVQVVSWPLGMIQMAKGASGWIYAGRTHGNALHLGFAVVLIERLGIRGLAVAFALSVLLQAGLVRCVATYLSGFRWSSSVLRLLYASGAAILLGLGVQQVLHPPIDLAAGSIIALAASLMSAHSIAHRLGSDHALARGVHRLLALRFLAG